MIAFSLFIALRRRCASSASTTAAPLSALLLLGAMTGGLRRRHVPQGQERLVLDDLPAAAGAAHLRPDAVRARRQRALPAVRRLRQELLRLQPARRLPRRPQRRRPLLERLPHASSSAPSRASCSAFFDVPDGPALEILGGMALYVAVSIASFALLDSFVKVSRAHDHDALRRGRLQHLLLVRRPDRRPRAARRGRVARRRDRARRRLVRAHAAQGEAVPGAGRAPAGRRRAPAAPRGRSLAAQPRAARPARPRSRSSPEDKRVAAKPGLTLLEIAEANGLPIEAGCRMGVCGADPVAIKDGMECLSRDLRRRARDARAARPRRRTRGWRAARASRARSTVALTPDKAERAAPQPGRAASTTTASVERVVVIGNGIAGVTAADHVRRRHPAAQIDLIAEEPHHLYNRMGIARLDLRPLGDAGPLPEPRRLVRASARSRPG